MYFSINNLFLIVHVKMQFEWQTDEELHYALSRVYLHVCMWGGRLLTMDL